MDTDSSHSYSDHSKKCFSRESFLDSLKESLTIIKIERSYKLRPLKLPYRKDLLTSEAQASNQEIKDLYIKGVLENKMLGDRELPLLAKLLKKKKLLSLDMKIIKSIKFMEMREIFCL